MRWVTACGIAVVMAASSTGCGDSLPPNATEQGARSHATSGLESTDLPPGPVVLLDREDVYLNGTENDERPPIVFLLLGSGTGRSAAEVDDVALAESYVELMRLDGWQVEKLGSDRQWWTYVAARGSRTARIGPASRFANMAKADEGNARPKFRSLISRTHDPLVVVAIDSEG